MSHLLGADLFRNTPSTILFPFQFDSESGLRPLILPLFSRSIVSDSLATPWTVACQSLVSMGFSRQEHWSGLPFSSPGNLPDPGIEPGSPELAGGCFIPGHEGSLLGL